MAWTMTYEGEATYSFAPPCDLESSVLYDSEVPSKQELKRTFDSSAGGLSRPEVSFDLRNVLIDGEGVPCSGIKQEPAASHKKEPKRKRADKGSEEYLRRREANNRAVKKSRQKAGQLWRETERRVSAMVAGNDALRRRLQLLANELEVLRGLLRETPFALPN